MSCGTAGKKFLPEQIVPCSDICWLSNLFLPSVHKHGNTAEFSPLIWAMNPQVLKEIHWLLCYSNKLNLFFSISGFLLKHLCREKLLKSFFGLLINKKTATKIKKKATLGAPAHRNSLQWQSWSVISPPCAGMTLLWESAFICLGNDGFHGALLGCDCSMTGVTGTRGAIPTS